MSFRWLGWLAALLVVSGVTLVVLAPTLVTRFIRSYVQKEEFRRRAEIMIAARTGGETRLAPLVWDGDNVSVAELDIETANGWALNATGAHLTLDFNAIRKGVWSVQSAGADELTLRRIAIDTSAPPGTSQVDASEGDARNELPAWLRSHIPTRTEVSGLDVRRFFFEASGWKIEEAGLRAGAWESGMTNVPVKLNGGRLQTPLQPAHLKEPLKLDISQATLRAGTDQLQLSDASLRWKTPAEATLRGSMRFGTGAWQLLVHAQGVPLEEFLDAWWQQRLSGKLKGDCDFSGSPGTAVNWKAEVVLENGVLQGLPILDKLATYTRAERFKRIVLDMCQASFRPEGDALRVENLIVQSNGLLRIEGSMTLRGRQVEGDFMLGVTPETLRWIPGADSRVFTQSNPNGPPGLLWTHVRVTGPVDAPQEDLSQRLIGSAGMALLFDTPGKVVNKGAEALLTPVLGEDAAKMPGKVIDGASGVIESGVKTGTGLLNKVLPIFPGK